MVDGAFGWWVVCASVESICGSIPKIKQREMGLFFFVVVAASFIPIFSFSFCHFYDLSTRELNVYFLIPQPEPRLGLSRD